MHGFSQIYSRFINFWTMFGHFLFLSHEARNTFNEQSLESIYSKGKHSILISSKDIDQKTQKMSKNL